MPTAYNPEEIARAKHLVALAEQINAKLDRRLPRFVSFSYTDNTGNDLLLDINANSWTMKFSALSASFRIISVHEDGAPTITFSNGVTSSNIVANGSTFTTTITLPSANVTSFTMTVSFPQTATFLAWSKTYNVDTATDKTVPAAMQLIVKSKTSQVTISADNEFTATLTPASFGSSTNVSVTANNIGGSYLGRPYFDNLTSTNQSGVVAATPATCYIGSSSWTIPMSLGSTDANQTIGADLIYPAIGSYASNTQHITVIITEG